jgi:hypothetical protein
MNVELLHKITHHARESELYDLDGCVTEHFLVIINMKIRSELNIQQG